jgi:antitoxin (DNA-binding transcriptional repressor) of toxin-antitoxin stability system
MKKVSIQDLKASLSATIADAEAGAIILVTRHGEPVAQFGPPRAPNVHGPGNAAPRLKPAVRKNTNGRYLVVLDDDRGNR